MKKPVIGELTFETRPSFKSIGFGIVGILMFGCFAYMMGRPLFKTNLQVTGVEKGTGVIIGWIIFGVFVFFFLACLFAVLQIKIVTMSKGQLTIRRPFLLLKLVVPLTNIVSCQEHPYTVWWTRGLTNARVYDGHALTIELTGGKIIRLNSFEISEYYLLRDVIARALKGRVNPALTSELNPLRYEGYPWLVFAIIVTTVLILALFKGGQLG